jgi:hypothetical protein
MSNRWNRNLPCYWLIGVLDFFLKRPLRYFKTKEELEPATGARNGKERSKIYLEILKVFPPSNHPPLERELRKVDLIIPRTVNLSILKMICENYL